MLQKINFILEKIVLDYLAKIKKEKEDEKYFEDILKSIK